MQTVAKATTTLVEVVDPQAPAPAPAAAARAAAA